MSDMKPVTVRAGTVGEVKPLQQEGLDRIVEYLANTLEPTSPLFPDTGRIVITWGDEEALEKMEMACPQCGKQLTGVEYAYNDPEHYDGVSEWACFPCGYHRGSWSGKLLGEGEKEPKYGKR